jgi:hypothetical protein
VKPALVAFCCRIVLLCGACVIHGCSGHRDTIREIRATCQRANMVEALNALRNDINARYGYRDGAPRINLGPCGRFARDFRARWNTRFREPVTIAIIMSNDGMTCHHVLVKVPDGRFFDGGNGVVTEAALMRLFSDSRIEEMKNFDLKLLDQRSYGLDRTYPECPNYSDEFTQQAIEKSLDALLNHRRPQ